MELSNKEFTELCKHIYKLCGLNIKDKKHYLVLQRLEPLAVSEGNGSFKGLIEKLSSNAGPQLKDLVIEAITTNETSFFRDEHPFEAFREIVLPQLAEMAKHRKHPGHHRKGSKINIWSAASSTGQEPYSIAMLIHEFLGSKGKGLSAEDFEIIATDISPKVLSKAIAGSYTDSEIKRGLSVERRDRFFRKEGHHWVINDSLRTMIDFKRINLAEQFTRLGGVDVIFCRNVLIYFDEETKGRILSQFSQMLSESGFLFLGACENVGTLPKKFKKVAYKESVVHQIVG
ncbi:MAG: protein-glutamate O-methyltransferase CheR [Nitrospinae bacterium]|nr:protein-glutamate O-methyltransferase CheR [Nitrospinota bacterium]